MQIGANLTARELANRCKFLDSSLYDEQTGAPTCKLHADAAVCLCCENRHRTTTRVRVQPHRRPFPSSSTKVGSSIHRVRPASGFLLVPHRKRRGAKVSPTTLASFRRVAPDWALTT